MKELFFSLLLLFFLSGVFCQTQQRNSIPEQYTWNLNDIYSSDDAWKSKKNEVTQQIKKLKDFKGKLNSSKSLLALLNKPKKHPILKVSAKITGKIRY